MKGKCTQQLKVEFESGLMITVLQGDSLKKVENGV